MSADGFTVEAIRNEARRWLADSLASARFLTRLPAPSSAGSGDLAASARGFPVVGIVVGLLGGIAYVLAASMGLPPLPAALIAVLATVLATGGLHEDGLADTADGLGGGRDA